MLRKIRIVLAAVFFALITLLFLDFSGFFHAWFSWTAKIQFVPALLALNIGVVLALVLLTLLAGRVYCSVICPLGVYQDGISRLAAWKKKYRFRFRTACHWMRYAFLALFVLLLVFGLGAWAALLEPYSIYGRIASNLFAPLYRWGNNLLALIAEHAESYAFYHVDAAFRGLPVFLAAVAFFVLVTVLAWRNGRDYCNHVCPVGTFLGLLSRYAWLRPVIHAEKCKDCKLCERSCKSSCIDITHHQIDYSRCVSCMDCVSQCKFDALHFEPCRCGKEAIPAEGENQDVDASRRRFLGTSAFLLAAGSVAKAQSKVDGGLADIIDKKAPARQTPVTPPGSLGQEHFRTHCTSCQLCVSACPNGVLQPSSELETFLQPEMRYESGYCRPECTRCGEVCPSGAIRPFSAAEKTSMQIGHAVWIPENCVVLTDHVSCGNCARHCPAGAITMYPMQGEGSGSAEVPMVDTERCIGCGACENLCPARPLSAIYVEGHQQHRTI